MKTLSKALAFIFLISFLSSCDLFNNDDDTQPQDEYLVSYEFVKSYLPGFIENLLNQFSDDYPDISSVKEKIKYGVMVYKVTYNTTFQGENKQASGLVCIPVGEGPFPVMSYQNGTNTLHSEAPSVKPERDLYLLLEFVTSTGFIVAIPDYLGFGVSDDMFHPYLHKESTVQTVLDLLRAIKELNQNYLDVAMNDRLYLTGYSQGGWATMQVEKAIELEHSDEFNLQAAASGAGPYDLVQMNEYITSQTNYPMPYFIGYMYNGYTKMNLITTPIGEVFQDPYATRIPTLYDGTKTGDEINAELTTTIADLFTADYLANYTTDSKYESVMSTLEENSVDAWNTSIPTLIIHGTDDDFVPIEISSSIYQDFLQKGVSKETVKMLPLPGEDHSDGIIPAGLASVNWFLQLEERN